MALAFFQSRRDQLCNDMTIVYHALSAACQHRRSYAKSWTAFGVTAEKMGTSQVSEMADKFGSLRELCAELGSVHQDLADSEERCAEDFRDVIERFYVLYRTNEEYLEAKRRYKAARETLLDIQYDMNEAEKQGAEARRLKLEPREQRAKAEKHVQLIEFKKKVAHLLHVKKSYNAFKVSRMRHAFVTYGDGIKAAAEREVEIYKRMQALLSELTLDEAATEAVAAQLAEPAPTPVPPETVAAQITTPEAEIGPTDELNEPDVEGQEPGEDNPPAVSAEEQPEADA